MIRFFPAVLFIFITLPTLAQTIVLSTSSAAKLGGLSFSSKDVVSYDTKTKVAETVWKGKFLTPGENVDAVHVMPDGKLIISTSTDAQLSDGATYRDGDLILIDPATGTSTLFFSEDLFTSGDEDIDAVHVLADGRILLSTTSTASINWVPFTAGDVARYDPATGSVDRDLFIGSQVFKDSENIDAITMRGNSLIFSTATDSVIRSSGVQVKDGDLVLYERTGYDWLDRFYPIFYEDAFAGDDEDIDAVW